MSRILIIEDNHDLAQGLANNLEIEGYVVDVVHDGADGLERARASDPSLIILDLALPGMDGYRVLSTLRGEGNDVPVLILTARSEEADKVRGFRYGADDYVTKPFGLLELLGRVHALLRRAGAPARENGTRGSLGERVHFGEIEVRPSTHGVYRRGFPVSLRPKEFELLMALLRRGGKIVPRLELLRDVWGYDAEVVSRTVDTHVAELRRKLEDDPANPRYIVTVRKAGYRIALD
ncbi:MAG TPA: response regulator transcription factor [Gemmatimonadaceae bacterium]|nr:response regulator transcription factor [Gemmatimonadaceae bacterium]